MATLTPVPVTQEKLVDLLLAIKSYENKTCHTIELVAFIETELRRLMAEGLFDVEREHPTVKVGHFVNEDVRDEDEKGN
ncbi:hypothetical protein [Bacillus solitudinis]|uniref:hypothetical protein n=1 Tax=Bacillus solitudinis TaxID=2014074 RepID=UPI000C232666|nr:hypothetical protein [Bacillus solitudinis]